MPAPGDGILSQTAPATPDWADAPLINAPRLACLSRPATAAPAREPGAQETPTQAPRRVPGRATLRGRTRRRGDWQTRDPHRFRHGENSCWGTGWQDQNRLCFSALGRAGDTLNLSDTWAVGESLSKMAGKHTVTFGGEARLMLNNQSNPSGLATFSFALNETRANPLVASSAAGDGLASLLR